MSPKVVTCVGGTVEGLATKTATDCNHLHLLCIMSVSTFLYKFSQILKTSRKEFKLFDFSKSVNYSVLWTKGVQSF